MQESFYEYVRANRSLKGNLPVNIVLVSDENEAIQCADICKITSIEHLQFPDFRAGWGDDLRSFSEEFSLLLDSLQRYFKSKKKPLIIAPFRTLSHSLPKPELFNFIEFEFASTVNLSFLKEQLLQWGYFFVDLVQVASEVSFRGDIIDIFPRNSEHPYRISLFDEEIESIRAFDLVTQKSIQEELLSIKVPAAFFALDSQKYSDMCKSIQRDSSDVFVSDMASLGLWHLREHSESLLKEKKLLWAFDFKEELDELYRYDLNLVDIEHFSGERLSEAKEHRPIIAVDKESLIEAHSGKKVTIITTSDAAIEQAGLYDIENYKIIKSDAIVNLVGPDEIVISLNERIKRGRSRRARIIVDELKSGDYVVHEEYGIAIFETIEQTQVMGASKEFVVLAYQGEDRVLLPVENLEVIDRYVGEGGATPVVDRLGRGSFAKLKATVRKRLFEIASEIVKIAAERQLIKAPVVEVDSSELTAFQQEAGFSYTQDQITSIDEIMADLKSSHVMDRLLSGDVGFGKTEVAMNAIFGVVKSGYQAAIVVPTTLLSSQHYKSLVERFKPYEFNIAKLDRFVSAKEKRNVLAGLLDGTLNVVVGTHALFGIELKNLAFVVIDEEHKFGVKQKEKLKQMSQRVHLLSMSATPIPRSLNMALSSIKTLSRITTPPLERVGVRTFVKSYNEKLLKEIITRELRRGGQIFYVYNSIAQMEIKKREIQKLLPNLRMTVLHSKIGATRTEIELMKFSNGEYDMLLSTSIIESGIHMPKVNTMIIEGADRFGMADLHQLRGRVGRGNTEGFSYFLIESMDTLTPEAKKRLVALESNSFLGSGSVLAYHDLEIRGGGNLLGDAQSGHIKNIGYSLYLRMLEDAINELTSHTTHKHKKVDIKLSVASFLSHELISEDRLRLELYRRLSQCTNLVEVYEIEAEVEDRFGKLDSISKQFFEIMIIKLLSIEREIKLISNYAQNISLTYEDGRKESIKASSRDDEDIIQRVLKHLRKKR